MPGIWNINNSYNVNSKKISSKLTFDVGEKFSGKVIKNGDGKEVTVKLIDGWEFSAEIEGNLDSLEKGLQNFQVQGFEDGKIKLKLVNKNSEDKKTVDGEFKNILLKEGLSKEDIAVLKTMLKHDIPLSKENIKEVKSLLQFLDKIQANPKEITEFINKYLQSKGIDGTTEKGVKIANKLSSFLNEFKNLSESDVLLFLENNIEFTEENIDGYNKLFKEEEKIQNVLKNISREIIEKDISSSQVENKDIVLDEKVSVIKQKDAEAIISINNKMAKGIYEKQELSSVKVSMLSLLKSIAGDGEDQINTGLKEMLNNRRTEFTSKEFTAAFKAISNIKPNDLITMIKNAVEEINNSVETSGYTNKENTTPLVNLENKMQNMESYSKRNNEINTSINRLEFTKGDIEKILTTIVSKNIVLTEGEFAKLKDMIQLKASYDNILKNTNIVDKNIDDIDLVNNKVSGKELNEEIKNGFKEIQGKDIEKNILKDRISSQEVVKEAILNKNTEGKEIIKDILSKIKGDNPVSEKIMEVIKNNINEIKVFNKISQEYYYADIPVNIREKEYPCKLIVKDNRKDGKKIDSTNVKMVVTVKTFNLGTIDGYIKVLDKKIDVDLKCSESFVKIIDMAKEKLVNNISSLGFNVRVNVFKKEEEVSLTNCREFFSSNISRSLDITV